MAALRNIVLGIALFAIVAGTGGYLYGAIEGHSFFEAFYTVFLTITTVGIPLAPKTLPGHMLLMVLMFFGMGTAIYIATLLAKTVVEGQTAFLLGLKGGFFRMRKEKNHTIVAGYGKLGKAVCDTLKQHKKRFVVIEQDQDRAQGLIEHGTSIVQGDALEPRVLKKAGIEKAKSLVAALGNDANNIYLVMTASELNSNVLLAAEANEESAVKRLHKIGAQIVVLPQVVGGRQLAQAVLEVDKAQNLSTVMKK